MPYTHKSIYFCIHSPFNPLQLYPKNIAQQGILAKTKHKMENDIFENKILCRKCSKPMKPTLISKNGFNLRTIRCEKCGELIVHPADKQEYDNFMKLKNKEFEVKMRMVGNSYAVSIPREIVDFMKDQENMMNNMVKMCFQDANRLSLSFNIPEMASDEDSDSRQQHQIHQRIVKSREISVIKNNKPLVHLRQVSDSAHPERNQTKIFRANKINKSEEDLEDEEEL